MVANVRPHPGSGTATGTRVIVNVEFGSKKSKEEVSGLFGFKSKSNSVPSANTPDRTRSSPRSKIVNGSPSVKVSMSVSLRKNSEPRRLTVLPLKAWKLLPTVPPEMLTVLPRAKKSLPTVPPEISTVLKKALKLLPTVPPEMLTVLPLPASKKIPTSPSEILTVLPNSAWKSSPTEPPDMLTSLPLFASKPSPTEPPEMLTSLPLLAPVSYTHLTLPTNREV